MGYFAVIDTETNWKNKVMSIGVVIADEKSFKLMDELYFIFDPEYKTEGMFSSVLMVNVKSKEDVIVSRDIAMKRIISALERYDVKKLFAYNAAFDKGLLGELSSYEWFDIMRIAAYRQFNSKIPANTECCKTGKMKRCYGVEPMMQLLSGNNRYREVHNALCDSVDELTIMRLLGHSLDIYEHARLG